MSVSFTPTPSGRIPIARVASYCGGVGPASVLLDWLRRRGEAAAVRVLHQLALPASCRIMWTASEVMLNVRLAGKTAVRVSLPSHLGAAAHGHSHTLAETAA